jgi:hypothetical protein
MNKPDTVTLFLSFADPKRPKGSHFLGGCFLEVKFFEDERASFKAAINKSWVLGINPGGEVLMTPMTDGTKGIHPSWYDVLLDRKTLEVGESQGWDKARPT